MKIGAFLLSLFTLSSLRGQPLVDRADSIFQLPSLSSPQEAVLLVLGTNDIHGHFSKSFDFLNSNNPQELGGYDWFAAYVRAAKNAIEQQYASKGKVLLLDGGDAAQGTLLSNPSEGKFAAQVMSRVGYTAAVPGNHAYDFGPQGESSDQCPALSQNCDPLETIKLFQATSHFPFLSANVYIGDVAQQRLFYKPYTLIEFLGRNIAIVGIENEATPSTTYSENVSQLKFTDGIAEVKKISKELKEQNRADLIIVVMHEGDAANNKTLEAWINKLQENEDQPLVDAIVAGHSHIKNQSIVKGIPYIQSYTGGQFFGAIALRLNQDPQTKKLSVLGDKQLKAAIPIVPQSALLWGSLIDVEDDDPLKELIEKENDRAQKKGATVVTRIKSSISEAQKRTSDSQIGNLIADAMRAQSGAEISIIGSGDIRTGIDKQAESGDLFYSQLFDVIPKNLQLVNLKGLPLQLFLQNLKSSVVSCGRRGALQLSGIKVYFKQDCSHAVNAEDPQAEILQVVADSGEIIYKRNSTNNRALVDLSTSDFILTGGAGYRAFREYSKDPINQNSIYYVGALRDLTEKWLNAKESVAGEDFKRGRYINCNVIANQSLVGCQ